MEKQINLWLRKQANGTWTVNGFVYDTDSGEAIVDATVILDRVPTQTNDRGFFQFEGIVAGEHVIIATAVGYVSSNDPNKPSVVSFVL